MDVLDHVEAACEALAAAYAAEQGRPPAPDDLRRALVVLYPTFTPYVQLAILTVA